MADKSQISMEEFRRTRATAVASRTGGKAPATVQSKYTSTEVSGKKIEQIRPPSASSKTTTTRQEDKALPKTLEGRCEKAKLLRDKQVEERKKKYEERKAAVEDRRRQKELEESAKHETLRHLLEHKGSSASKGSGRKLPNLPRDGTKDPCRARRETLATRRVSSGSSSGESPVHTPPGSTVGTQASRRSLTGPSSASTSCLNNFGYNQTKGSLGASKKTSSSTSNLTDKMSGKAASKPKEKSVVTRSVAKSTLPKAQSTGAIHQLGTGTARGMSRPKSSTKKQKSKASPVHHAGTSNEQEAKLALAEHRRKMREEAERQALLDKEKQEQLRIEREAEEKRLAEEKAKEEARQAELSKLLKAQEEERARLLHEQQEKEEAERIAADAKRKEEAELMKKMELERRAKEAEKREKEEEERLRKEEEERQERRKRVETIMSRTRMTAAANNNNDMMKVDSLAEKSPDDQDHHQSPTVSEILQKVKSRRSPNSPDNSEEKENEEWFDATDNNIKEVENGSMTLDDTNNVTSLAQ